MPEITLFISDSGPLTKQFSLDSNGKLVKTTSARMCTGTARRLHVKGIREFAEIVGKTPAEQAYSLAKLRSDLKSEVKVTTKRRLNGSTAGDIIARTKEFLVYDESDGFVLIDFDELGMPEGVRDRIASAGGVWPALCRIMPELATTARFSRASTSAGIYHQVTHEGLVTSSNAHIYVHVKNVSDAVRFLKTTHDRCWLAGYGWFAVGRSGQLLERSIVDRMVGSPERLNFEGPAQLILPLAQFAKHRQPNVVDGDTFDTVKACTPLTILEKARKAELLAKAAQALSNAAAKLRAIFVQTQAGELAKRKGISHHAAAEIVKQMNKGILRPDIMLEFDDQELAGTTVADILADPEKYAGETMADPLEGVEYGPCKAMVMVHDDGVPWIHSFAHGLTVYELKHDCNSVRAAIDKAPQAEVVNTLVDITRNADLTRAEDETIIALVQQRSGLNLRSIRATLKNARQDAERERREASRKRILAERADSRPMLATPRSDAPFLPVIDVINEVLAAATDRIPPARNIEGSLVRAQRIRVPEMHLFDGANEDSDITGEAPPQMVIKMLTETNASEMIERHIEYVDSKGEPVHLHSAFVSHYMCQDDGALPVMAAVATLPMVSADGHLIYTDGLDRKRGIAFDVAPSILKLIPPRDECTPQAVGTAMEFLTDEWLVDVSTDYSGKCTLVALALTIIQRSLLDSRPVWFITAGRRGGGKTTTLQMIIQAVTGMPASAAAWSPNEEERRKALMSYLLMGVPYVLWDNIPRGIQIACPHIERACTSAVYSDRKLAVSEIVQAASSAVHCFTGNNVGPRGDLASRALHVRLTVDRIDPENRQFKHQDPVGWTQANRGKILQALFVVLLGNKELTLPVQSMLGTRFKRWQRLVGSAVEYAASLCVKKADASGKWEHMEKDEPRLKDKPVKVDFAKLFLDQESEDEDSSDLTDCLVALANMCVTSLTANDLSNQVNNTHTDNTAVVREFLFPGAPPDYKPTPKAIAKRLSARVDDPVRSGDTTLTLKSRKDDHSKVLRFWVETRKQEARD